MVFTQRAVIVSAVAIAIMAFATLGDLFRHPDAALVKSDFSAFYCGALVAREHGDPYALGPLRDCEASRVDRPGGADPATIGVDPDPLPGYVMALFAPFTFLPYREAALVWTAVLIAAIALTAVLCAELSGLPVAVVAATLAFADGLVSVTYGQIPPVLTFALTLAGYGLAHERRMLVLIGAALSMIEPHIGLPACCALFVWRPVLRPGLAVAAAILGTLSLVTLGFGLNVEYARVELPAHAAAEALTSLQYSFAWLLHYLGVADATAIRLASLQYAAFAVAAIALAGPVARRLQTPAALALFPPALVLIGGSFVHVQQMAAAIPLALVSTGRLGGRWSGWAWVALTLLAVPWPANSRLISAGALAIVASIVCAALAERRSVLAVAGVALCAAVLYAGLAGPVMLQLVPALPRHQLAAAPPMPRASNGDLLASDEDAREERHMESFAIATPRTLAAKIPTWVGLCTLVAVSLAGRRARRSLTPEPA